MSKKRQFKSILCMLMTFVMVFTSVDSGIIGMKTVFAEAAKEDSLVAKNENKTTENSKKDDTVLKTENKANEKKKEVVDEKKKESSSKNIKNDIEKPSINEEKKDVIDGKLDIQDIVNKIQSDSIGTISIKIINDFTKVKVGDKIELQVQDENNQAVPVENLTFTINDEKLGKMNNYKPNKFMAIGSGSVVIKAALKDKPNISDEVHFKIQENVKDVYIRVEGYDHTIIPRTKVSIPLVDLPKLGTVDKYSNPTHAHAILKVLLDKGFKVGNGEKGTIRYNVPFYLSKLDGDGEFDQGRFSGWMYRVNGELPPIGAEGKYLEDGDEIIWFYGAFGFLNAFTEISVDKTEISENESVVLTAKGEETDINTYEKRLVSMKDATVVITKIVNGKEEDYNKLGEIKTDKDGKATLNFKENGEYKLSLIRYGSDETTKGEKKINIVRPVPITIKVRENNDKGSEKPVIKLEGIKDGQEINEENLSFKVTAIDNKNKNIKPIVKLNEEVVTGTNGEYKAILKDGENTITIEATDIEGNRAYEVYKITYKQKTKGKVHLRVELKDETDFSDEITIPSTDISLKDLLEIPVDDIFEEQKYTPKFNEEGKLISLDEDNSYYSVIINGKAVENPKTVMIKTGDSVICSYNGATKQFKLETPKEAIVNEEFKVVVKDEQDKVMEDAKVFAQYFKYWNGYWDKPIQANTNANGIASFKLETKGDYRIFAEKDGYIRAAAQPIQVILPKIEGDFPKKVNNNEEFNIILTANGKTEPDVKIYWESYYEDKVAYLDNSKLIGKTDANGKATGKIKASKGEYTLIANFHNNSVNLGQIIILENDTQKPEIKVNGIKDNTVLSTKEAAFTVHVTDNVDENIIPEVKCNDKVITEKDGKYSVVLNEGNNTIEITAKDKAGNTENKKYTLVYKSNVIVNKIVIEGSKERLHPKDKITLKGKAVDEQNNVIPGKEFIFSSSDEKVATVDSKTGEVTAIGNGTVILTAALKDDGKIKESVKVTVTDKYEVYMRIEGYDHTILPRTKLEVGLFDLSEHLGKASGSSAGESNGWDVSKFEKPTNAHAIVKALVDAGFRQKKAGDTDETKLFDFQDYGWSLYIAMIDGDREHDHAGMSGWLYRVNDDLPPVGCNGTSLNDGDEIVWMYSPYGFDNIYTKVLVDETNVSVNNEVQIKLTGYTGGYEKVEEKVDGATILVNGKPYIKDGKEVVTGVKGNATLTFDKPGDYTICATRLDDKDLIDIVRPNPVVIHVRDKSDEQKPEISVKGIMNGETVNKSEITFTVTAKDPQDGKLTPIVKCNDKVLIGKDDSYKAVLKEGKNTITVKAEDKDKNVVEKTFEIICDTKDKTLPQIKVEGIESGITSTQQAAFTVEANDKNDGKITPVVKFNDKEILPQEGKYKALLQEGLNTITIEAVNKLGNKAIEVFKITYNKATEEPKNKEELRKKILEILPETVDYSTKESFSNDWVTAGLGRLKDYKNKISPSYLQDTAQTVKALAAEQDKGNGAFKVTDFERITMGVVAAGGDPTNIDGVNIIERIYNPRKTTKGQDYIDRQGLNAVIWGLIAVDSKNYEIPEGAAWNRDKFIKEILDNECLNENHTILKGKKGGWQFGGKKNIDPDMTGMAMIALAPYYNTREDVKAAVDRAVENLSLIQREDGGYASWGTVNSESCVQVIMGLCANNFDPMGEKFTKKGGNVIDALLRFKVEGTGFAHAPDPMDDNKLKANGMANEQALYGLSQLMYCLDGNKGSIFKWAGEKPEKPEEPKNFVVKRIGEGNLKKGSSAEVKFNIENVSKEAKEVTLAIVLFDKKTNEMKNYSYVKKNLKAGAKEEFAGGFKIPESGQYEVKAIICDDLNPEKMNILADPVKITVE